MLGGDLNVNDNFTFCVAKQTKSMIVSALGFGKPITMFIAFVKYFRM